MINSTYDPTISLIVLGSIILSTALLYGLYQWTHWIEHGYFWDLRPYKGWYVRRFKRTVVSLLAVAIVLSFFAGFIRLGES